MSLSQHTHVTLKLNESKKLKMQTSDIHSRYDNVNTSVILCVLWINVSVFYMNRWMGAKGCRDGTACLPERNGNFHPRWLAVDTGYLFMPKHSISELQHECAWLTRASNDVNFCNSKKNTMQLSTLNYFNVWGPIVISSEVMKVICVEEGKPLWFHRYFWIILKTK